MSLRINKFINRSNPITITLGGQTITAYEGESVAVALHVAGIQSLRRSPGKGMPRSAFCYMGVCQECLVIVDHKRALACQTPVKNAMTVNFIDDSNDPLLDGFNR